MSKYRIRPRFKCISTMTPEAMFGAIQQQIDSPDVRCSGWVSGSHAKVNIIEEDRHYWSPQMEIRVEEAENGTSISCLVGPNAAVWTGFIFIYTLVAFFALVGVFYGLIQLNLDKDPTAFWLLPVSLFFALVIYLMARYGQYKGAAQMNHLRNIVNNALSIEFPDPAVASDPKK
jgi:hypothetical protein